MFVFAQVINLNRIMKFNSVFQALDFVELSTLNRTPRIASGRNIKRTTNLKHPRFLKDNFMVRRIRSVSSIDFCYLTTFPINKHIQKTLAI
jgi:hypothetical protein